MVFFSVGTDVNTVDKTGLTPLAWAAAHRQVKKSSFVFCVIRTCQNIIAPVTDPDLFKGGAVGKYFVYFIIFRPRIFVYGENIYLANILTLFS